jgi:hypothetical protein
MIAKRSIHRRSGRVNQAGKAGSGQIGRILILFPERSESRLQAAFFDFLSLALRPIEAI